jgi:DNA transposition AAA+ family ATPase
MVQQEKLSEENKVAIQAKVNAYIIATNISNKTFCENAGFSTANISLMRNGKWETIGDDIWHKADKAANPENTIAKQDKFQWRMFSSKSLVCIDDICKDAQENNRMMAVYGETGFGKSAAFTYYKYKNPVSCYYVLCDELMNPKQFLQAIAKELGVESEGDKSTILGNIVSYLGRQKNPLLILDDVGKLNDSCSRLIRLIYDKTVDKVGIVLSGTTKFKNDIDKKVRKDTAGFRELHRRIEYWQLIDKPEEKVVEAICVHHGITQQDCVDYIKTFHAANFGKLKSCIMNVLRLMKKEPMSLELLKRIR